MILVTGGSGLVGAHLLFDLVENNKPVKAIYRSKSSISKIRKVFSYYTDQVEEKLSQINFVEADLLDLSQMEKALEGVSQIVHAAAFISFSQKDYLKMRAVNIEGTAQLVNLALSKGVKDFVFLSSIATLSSNKRDVVCDESTSFDISISNYGYAITKYGAELEVWRGQQEGLNVHVFKPGVILGPGFWHENSGKLFKSVYNGLRFYAEGVTGFVGVWDVVKALSLSLDKKLPSNNYVLVSENKSYRFVFEHIAKALNKKAPSIPLNKPLVQLLWRVSWVYSRLLGQKDFFSKKQAQSVFNKSLYNGGKIVKESSDFNYLTFDQSIKKVAQCLLDDTAKA